MNNFDHALMDWYCLAVFQERYGGAWRALIAPDMEGVALIQGELTAGGDIGAVEMQRYLGSAGTLFPTSEGHSPSSAIARLDTRLAGVGDWKAWRARVDDAYQALRDAHRLNPDDDWWVGRAHDERRLLIME